MSEARTTIEKKGKWAAYVCPSCQSIFRLITSAQSQSSRCPTCLDYINIPSRSESQTAPWNPDQQPILAQAASSPSKQEAPKDNPTSRQANPPTEDWQSTHKKDSPPNSKKPWVTVFCLSLLGIIAPLILITKHYETKRLQALVADPSTIQHAYDDEFSSPEPQSDPDPVTEADLTNIRSINESIELCSKAITPFLEASTVEELLPHVHNRDYVEPLIRAYYEKFPYQKRGLNKVLVANGARVNGKAYTLNIVTSDYSNDTITCVDQGDETFLVDWESWIGYSELTQDELRKKKPTKPISVRVIAKKTNYYNFQFSDETQWQAYQLSTKDSDDILYGYVKKASPVHIALNAHLSESNASAFHLKVRYPQFNSKPSQVLIDSVISNGWASP